MNKPYSEKLKNFGKWLWRNKGKIIAGGLIAGGLFFLGCRANTFAPYSWIGQTYSNKLTLNPLLHPISHLLGEGEIYFVRDLSREVTRVVIGNRTVGIYPLGRLIELVYTYTTKSALRHLPLYVAIGQVISFGLPSMFSYIRKKIKRQR